MSNQGTRLFVVSCKHCGRTLLTVARIRDAEIKALVDHLRVCPPEALGESPALGEVMAQVRVTSVTP